MPACILHGFMASQPHTHIPAPATLLPPPACLTPACCCCHTIHLPLERHLHAPYLPPSCRMPNHSHTLHIHLLHWAKHPSFCPQPTTPHFHPLRKGRKTTTTASHPHTLTLTHTSPFPPTSHSPGGGQERQRAKWRRRKNGRHRARADRQRSAAPRMASRRADIFLLTIISHTQQDATRAVGSRRVAGTLRSVYHLPTAHYATPHWEAEAYPGGRLAHRSGACAATG